MITCELCGKEIQGEPAVIVNKEGSRNYCYDEPLSEASCYIKFLRTTNQDWVGGELINNKMMFEEETE